MHGMNSLKTVCAQQAKLINNFRNAKQKLLKTKAAIWFNKICRINQLTPTVVHLVGLIN
jgi:hypothetical protein